MLKIRNNTSFPIVLEQFFKNIKHDKDDFLLYHQRLVIEYVMRFVNLRGILIFHEMGAGKSILAISICELLAKQFPNYKKVFLIPKSLQDNMKINMEKINVLNSDYIFISSNANNLADQIVRKFYNLENTIVVVDEAHNLFNALSNGSGNAIAVYNMLLNAKNIKCIFLTGTPIINDPFEIVLMFNILSGYINVDKHFNETLFSEYYETFNSLVIKKIIDNDSDMKLKFMSRIIGFVSYYNYKDHINKAGNTTDGNATEDVGASSLSTIPIKLERKIIEVPMSDKQFSMYVLFKKKEEEEVSFKENVKNVKFNKKNNVTSSYKIYTRQLCNMLYPEVAMEESKHIFKKLPDYFYKDINIYSPKISKIYEITTLHKDQKGYIYSQFLDCGIYPIGEYLKFKGYEEFVESATLTENNFISIIKKKRYCYLTGEMNEEVKSKNLMVFNSKQNINGEIIQLMLVSSVGTQGISLNCVKFVIIMEPYWNQVRIDQVENRGIRIGSHADLPKNERTITPYILIAKTLDDKESTDMIIYKDAIEKGAVINKFLDLLKMASIDCSVHGMKNCFKCKPTDKTLFEGKIEHDINRCETWLEEKLDVKEINIKNEKYYYNITNGKVRIFKWNSIIAQYEEIFIDNPVYEVIYDIVKK